VRYVTALLFTAVSNLNGLSIHAHSSSPKQEVPMRPLMNVKHRDDQYFHPHPFQSLFALVGCITLGGLIMLMMIVALDH
jgi:hypothetical protein